MKITALCGAVAMTLLTAGTNVMAGPSGEMLSYTCAGCHGTDGSSVGPSSPHLAGMNQDYFTEAMQDYKDGKRNPTIMDRLAKGYTDEQIAAMAEFFAAQTLRLTPQKYDAAKAKVGAKLHDKYCEKCHEDGGTKADEAGVLAGQWAPYLRFTMADYLSGKREMSKKMAKKVEKMHKKDGDAGVDALIQYYSSKK